MRSLDQSYLSPQVLKILEEIIIGVLPFILAKMLHIKYPFWESSSPTLLNLFFAYFNEFR